MKRTIVSSILLALALTACDKQPTQTTASSNVNEGKALSDTSLSSITQAQAAQLANDLAVNYKVITNIPSDKCDQSQENGLCFEVELSFTAKQASLAKDWTILFSHIAPIQSFESDELEVKHLNGDLHKISLADGFKGFAAGETKTLKFRALYWSLSEYDAMPNYIITGDNIDPVVIESTKPYIDPVTKIESMPFVEPFSDYENQFKRSKDDSTQWLNSEALYQRNKEVNQSSQKYDIASAIIPTPRESNLSKENTLDLSSGIQVNFNNVKPELVEAALSRIASLGITVSDAGIPVVLNKKPDNNQKIGSYELSISENAINVTGVDDNGVFNGLQSLASLIVMDSKVIPQGQVKDAPHYAFRGILVDVARNFHSKDFILRLLDQMAAYKLNKLHLHLGDDEGWRLEIPSLPELTEVGSKRCFDLQEQECLVPQLGAGLDKTAPVNGYYSVEDYTEILQAATARHIQVLPSLDMPGHSRAAVKSMAARYQKYMALEEEEKANEFLLYDANDPTVYSSVQFYGDNTINACMESSYAFVEEVMTQVKKIHADAGQPLTRYHIGADETAGAWVESEVCKQFLANNDKGVTEVGQLGAYFVERVSNMLAEMGIEAAAWSDGLEHTRTENMPAIVQANAWGHLPWQSHQQTHELANRNWQIVISTPDVLYFDFPYEADPKEHGYYWASRHTNTEKVFQFMPDNLPVHAEFWLDRQDNAYSANDTVVKDEKGNIKSKPLDKGRKFLGIQGQLWSENTRTDSTAEYKIYPRLFALAERAWHLADWAVPYNYDGFEYSQNTKVFTEEQRAQRDAEWARFAHILGQKELVKLEQSEIDYRLPTVGAVIENGILKANTAFPGLTIEFQEQGKAWQKYTGEVEVTTDVNVRTSTFEGKRKGRITTVAKK